MAKDEGVVNRAAAESARRGHPWIWREAIARGAPPLSTGAVVQVLDATGGAVGRGVYDPGSPIAIRMWTGGRGAVVLGRSSVGAPEGV